MTPREEAVSEALASLERVRMLRTPSDRDLVKTWIEIAYTRGKMDGIAETSRSVAGAAARAA